MIVWSRQTGHCLGGGAGESPRWLLSFGSGGAIKRITAGVKAPADRSLLKYRSAAEPSPPAQASFEKRILRCLGGQPTLHFNNRRYKTMFEEMAAEASLQCLRDLITLSVHPKPVFIDKSLRVTACSSRRLSDLLIRVAAIEGPIHFFRKRR